jgi:hypothetical protein
LWPVRAYLGRRDRDAQLLGFLSAGEAQGKIGKRAPPPGSTNKRKKSQVSLPDLDQAKSAVLNTVSSADAQRIYRHAIDEFIQWYRSEPKVD